MDLEDYLVAYLINNEKCDPNLARTIAKNVVAAPNTPGARFYIGQALGGTAAREASRLGTMNPVALTAQGMALRARAGTGDTEAQDQLYRQDDPENAKRRAFAPPSMSAPEVKAGYYERPASELPDPDMPAAWNKRYMARRAELDGVKPLPLPDPVTVHTALQLKYGMTPGAAAGYTRIIGGGLASRFIAKPAQSAPAENAADTAADGE